MATLPTWDDLCGEHVLTAFRNDVRHPFNSDANGCSFSLDGDLTVLVFEDPSDGYRSAATEPFFSRASIYSLVEHHEPVRVPVLVARWTASQYGGDADGITMIDRRNGKTILQLGTDNSDDYYPSFVCDWTPKNIATEPTS